MIKYGYFDVKPEIEAESWQVNTDDFTVEVQTTLDATPKKLVCVYIDDKETLGRGASLFVGGLFGNFYTGNTNNDIRTDAVPFTSSNAMYLRFEEGVKTIYVHVLQWQYVKCGKWMWIAIYDE